MPLSLRRFPKTESDRSRGPRRSCHRHSGIRHKLHAEHRRDADEPIFAAVWNGQSRSDGNCPQNHHDLRSCHGWLSLSADSHWSDTTMARKNKKRFNETIRFAFLLEVLTGAGMAVVLGAAAPLLVGLFLKDARCNHSRTADSPCPAHRHAVCWYRTRLDLYFPGDRKRGRRTDSFCRTSGRDFCHCNFLRFKDLPVFPVLLPPSRFRIS